MRYGFTLARLIAITLTMSGMAGTSLNALGQSIGKANISSSDDCTKITINYTLDGQLTREEAISRMDEAFYESLNKFDACQMSQSASSSSASATSGSSGSAGATSGQSAGSGDSPSSASSSASVTSPSLSGTETPISDSSIAAEARERGDIISTMSDKQVNKRRPGDIQTSSGKIPEDIPPVDNDTVLEAQIRQAAMNETDPETREKLWREYRKYKGLPQPGG